MIHFMRTSGIQPGKVADAHAFAGEMNEFLASAYGQKMQLMVPVGGNPFRLCWYTSFENLAALESFQGKSGSDPKYLSILAKGAGIFIAGSAHDDIWRAV
jgi:hypothetical protein